MRHYYEVLLFLGRWSDFPTFQPFHKVWSKLFILIYPHFLRFFLRPHECRKIVLRHSIYKSHFNLFFSDVDFTILAEGDLSLDQCRAIQVKYLWLKSRVPNLGEYELYEMREWEKKERLQREEPFLQKVRALRKLRWAYKDNVTHNHQYHVYKRSRGFQKIADLFCHENHHHNQECLNRNLDLEIRDLVKKNDFKIKCENPLQSVDHAFLGLRLSTTASEQTDVILSCESLNHFIALLPSGEQVCQLQDERSKRFRSVILQDEYISVRSYLRLHPEKENEIRGWMDYLEQEIAKLS